LLDWFYPPGHKVWLCFPDAEAPSAVAEVACIVPTMAFGGEMLRLANGAMVMSYQVTKLKDLKVAN
jgi:hypothetical protein